MPDCPIAVNLGAAQRPSTTEKEDAPGFRGLADPHPGSRVAYAAGRAHGSGHRGSTNPARFSPARASTSWEAYTYLPNANQAGVKGLLALFDTLRSDTNGELVINLHLGGSLPINATSITPTVSDNIVQFGTDGFFSGNLPIAGLLRLPMLLRSAEEFATAEAIAAPFIDAAYLKKGVVALGEYTYPLQTVWSRRKLTSLEDIKGQKLRVTSVEMGEFVKRFGGIPLTMGTSDVPAALDRGVIDGVLTATSGAGLTWKDPDHGDNLRQILTQELLLPGVRAAAAAADRTAAARAAC